MKPSSILIEINPYKYSCLNWYQTAAKGAGLKFIKYVASLESEFISTDNQILKDCWDGIVECQSIICTNLFSMQNIIVDSTNFENVLRKELNQL